MLVRAAALLALLAAPALAQSTDCEALRRVLAIAQRADLDPGELSRLEPRLCGAPAGRGAACQQLDAFWMLAMALEQPQDVLSGLEAQRAVWCGRGDEPARALQWLSGAALRTSSGTLLWPNGAIARASSGAWYAPSGALARSSSGALYYPAGPLARGSSGRWSLPSGEYADEGRLAGLACQADAQWCRFFLGEAQRSGGERRDFALLGLGRLADRAR